MSRSPSIGHASAFRHRDTHCSVVTAWTNEGTVILFSPDTHPTQKYTYAACVRAVRYQTNYSSTSHSRYHINITTKHIDQPLLLAAQSRGKASHILPRSPYLRLCRGGGGESNACEWPIRQTDPRKWLESITTPSLTPPPFCRRPGASFRLTLRTRTNSESRGGGVLKSA